MKIAIMQPYLFPYIGYFQLIRSVNKFVLFDDVNFIKKGWINRNNILINGKANLFSVPLKEVSQNKMIADIYLASEIKWKSIFLRTIEQNYKKAPFYNIIYPLIEQIINSPVEKIGEMIKISLGIINNYLGIGTEIVSSSSVYGHKDLKGEQRIIEICKMENAKGYINLIGGKEIYSKKLFLNEGIEIGFLQTRAISYDQKNGEFIPWLSIIDVMMFNSTEEINQMLDQYDLV